MSSGPQSSGSQQNNSSPSEDFSIIESSQSRHLISQVPQSSSVTPERQSSSYEWRAVKGKKKTNKKTLKKSKIKQKNKTKAGGPGKFLLSPYQAAYLNQKGCPKQYSLQNVNKNDQRSPLKKKGMTLSSKGFNQSGIVKYRKSEFLEGKFVLSEGYHFIEGFINELLKEKEIPEFFKKNIEEITKFDFAGKYYSDYKRIVQNPLNLSLLSKMIQDGRIRNYIEFKIKFEEMILSSRYYHTLKGNLRMINCGEFLRKKLQEKICQELYPEGNTYEEDIKVLERKRPKCIDGKIENQDEKTIILMDLEDEYNKYRLSVMNNFLRQLCLEHQQRLEIIVAKLQNILNRYSESKVEIIREEERKHSSIEKKGIMKKSAQQTRTESVSKSPQSSTSEIISEPQNAYIRIKADKIEVDLFQQMKKFISREVQQKKDFLTFGAKIREERQQIMYRHEDSSDFDLDDDSDDS